FEPTGPAAALRRWTKRLREGVQGRVGTPPPVSAPISAAVRAPAPSAPAPPAAAPAAAEGPEQRLRHGLVTVVVPVYNAYDETCACLASLVRHGRHPHRVLLLDGRRTDARGWP